LTPVGLRSLAGTRPTSAPLRRSTRRTVASSVRRSASPPRLPLTVPASEAAGRMSGTSGPASRAISTPNRSTAWTAPASPAMTAGETWSRPVQPRGSQLWSGAAPRPGERDLLLRCRGLCREQRAAGETERGLPGGRPGSERARRDERTAPARSLPLAALVPQRSRSGLGGRDRAPNRSGLRPCGRGSGGCGHAWYWWRRRPDKGQSADSSPAQAEVYALNPDRNQRSGGVAPPSQRGPLAKRLAGPLFWLLHPGVSKLAIRAATSRVETPSTIVTILASLLWPSRGPSARGSFLCGARRSARPSGPPGHRGGDSTQRTMCYRVTTDGGPRSERPTACSPRTERRRDSAAKAAPVAQVAQGAQTAPPARMARTGFPVRRRPPAVPTSDRSARSPSSAVSLPSPSRITTRFSVPVKLDDTR